MTLPALHDFQKEGVANARDAILKGGYLLQVAPTGTGKTVMQCAVLSEATEYGGRTVLQVVPSMEIAAGFARWLGLPFTREDLEDHNIYTAKRLVNLVTAGKIDPTRYDAVQIDEAHHSVDDTHQTIDAYLGSKPRVGWTATGYRGTPKETQRLSDWWAGNVRVLLSETDAIERGFASAPSCEVWPLVNDEKVSITKGEFSTVGLEAETEDALEELVGTVVKKFWDPARGKWDRPTMLALPTVYLVEKAKQLFDHFGAPALAVTGETTDRQHIFADVVAGRSLLVQVKVVGEGVDLPLRRLIDASPTMSPVFWRQRIGRIMRPVPSGSIPPEYVVTNHNLLRHGYLLKGILPPSVFREAVSAWGPDFKPSRRMVARVAGLTGLGRFAPSQVPLPDGSFWWLFVVGSPDGDKHYASLVNPAGGDPINAVRYFHQEAGSDGKVRKQYSKSPPWKRIKTLPDLVGYTSVPPDPLTPGMLNWWKSGASFRGLDPEAEIDARQFQVLPILTDIGGKFRPGGDLR